MPMNKVVRFGPVALPSVAGNVLNPGTVTGGTGMPANSTTLYFILRHVRVVNKTNAAVTVSLWVGASGATAAGTEFAFNGFSVAANSYVDSYDLLRLDSTDFLVGQAGAGASLTFTAEGEMGVS